MCHWESVFFPAFSPHMAVICENTPSSFLPGTWAAAHRVCVCVCVCVCVFVLTLSLRMFFLQVCVCVCSVFCPEVERAPVQLSGSDHDLTLPTLFCPTPRPSRCGHAQVGGEPACLPASHVLVCQRECTFHTCDHRGGNRSSKLLCEGA